MSARSFLDTNVLVYTDDHDTPDKQRVALDLVEQFRLQRAGVVSTQVLQEYFAAATRKLKVRPDLARRPVWISCKWIWTFSCPPSISIACTCCRSGMP